VTEAPSIDGVVGDEEWAAAEAMSLVLTDTAKTPRQATTVRAVWTEMSLFIAFVCEDDDIWADKAEHDAEIYQSEVVEVFIDANSDGKTYVELEINPVNAVLDLYVLNPGQRKPFTGLWDFECKDLRSAVKVEGTVGPDRGRGQVDDTRWSVEIEMPFAGFPLAEHHPPRPGDTWRWNLYRIDRPADEKHDEYAALSPTGEINYHRPDRFGTLLFLRSNRNPSSP
jgi:hypothetical protein